MKMKIKLMCVIGLIGMLFLAFGCTAPEKGAAGAAEEPAEQPEEASAEAMPEPAEEPEAVPEAEAEEPETEEVQGEEEETKPEKETESEETEETEPAEKKEESAQEIGDVSFSYEGNGIIKNVGCDRSKTQVYVKISNTGEKVWNYYKKELGQSDIVKLKHNSRVGVLGVDLECGGESLKPGEEAVCVLSNAEFRTGSGINGEEIKDRVIVQSPEPSQDVAVYSCQK